MLSSQSPLIKGESLNTLSNGQCDTGDGLFSNNTNDYLYNETGIHGSSCNSCNVNRKQITPGKVANGNNAQLCKIQFTNWWNCSYDTNCYTYIGLSQIILQLTEVNSQQFHCSPLLARPKDLNKRRVILNLPHPHGASLYDIVDKEYFDGSPFALKFPSIDDIVQHISHNDTEILLSKIDVSRVFCNLGVDPADAVKFGIKWKDHYNLDLVVAFGWIHGSSSFQLIANVITHIMKCKGFLQVFAYIDDFVLVNRKHKAREAFDTLHDLLGELGLPMNEDKTVPPMKAHMFGYTY